MNALTKATTLRNSLLNLSCLLTALVFMAGTSPILAQSTPESRELKKKGEAALDAGSYGDAEAVFKEWLQKFPKNDLDGPTIKYLLGLSLAFQGSADLKKYEEAITYLKDSKELQKAQQINASFEMGRAYLGLKKYEQAILAMEKVVTEEAARMKKKGEDKLTTEDFSLSIAANFFIAASAISGGSEAKTGGNPTLANKLFTKGIKATSTLLALPDERYEKELISLKTDSQMTRAQLLINSDKFDEAKKDLLILRDSPEALDYKADVDILLAAIYSQQAAKLLGDHDTEAAKKPVQQAREIYTRISNGDDLILATDARFSLAQLMLVQGDFEKAIEAYRGLPNKAEMIDSQKRKVEKLRGKVGGTTGKALERLQRTISRESGKLKQVEQGSERGVDALKGIADCYLSLKRWDEARVIYRYLIAINAKDAGMKDKVKADLNEEMEKQIIVTLAMQGRSKMAEEKFDTFRSSYPESKHTQSVPFAIAIAYVTQASKETEYKEKQKALFNSALTWLETQLKDFPKADNIAQVPVIQAEIYRNLGEPQKAIDVFKQFINRAASGEIKVPRNAVDGAKRSLAATLYSKGRTDKNQALVDEGVSMIKDLKDNASEDNTKMDSHWTYATMLKELGKLNESVQEYDAYVTAYPQSDKVLTALWTKASIQEKKKDLPGAIGAYESIYKNHPDTPFALSALQKIYGLYGKLKQADKAQETMNIISEKYPDADFVLFAVFKQARALEKEKKYPEANAGYNQFLDLYKRKKDSGGDISKLKKYGGFAIMSMGVIAQAQAKAIGNSDPEAWKRHQEDAVNHYERILREFPDVTEVIRPSLAKIESIIVQRIKFKTMEREAGMSFFSKLAGTLQDEQTALAVKLSQANVLFTLGAEEQAIITYERLLAEVSNPKLISFQVFRRIGDSFMSREKWDKLEKIGKQMMEVHNSGKIAQHAQSDGIFFIGRAKKGLGDSAGANKLFEELKQKYPWSPRLLEADIFRAIARRDAGNYEAPQPASDDPKAKPADIPDDQKGAIDILEGIVKARASGANAEKVKARALIEIALTLEMMHKKKLKSRLQITKKGKKLTMIELAVDQCKKVHIFYGEYPASTGLPELAAEALYNGVRILAENGQKDKALKFFDGPFFSSDIYLGSQWRTKAESHL